MTCCNLTSFYYANTPTQQSHFSYANTATHPSHLFFCEHGNSAISPILMRTRQLSHLSHSYANTATQPSHLFLCEHRKCEHRNAAISHIYSFANTATQPHWNLLEVPEKSEQFRTVVPNSGAEQWCRTVRNSSRTARQLLGNCRELCPNCSELFGLSRNLLKV